MSLATSCPACGTVFKVVEDQLKVSEGWVRCGHCHDVFNALEGLFDLQRKDSVLGGLPIPASRESAPPPPAAPPATPLAPAAAHGTDAAVDMPSSSPAESMASIPPSPLPGVPSPGIATDITPPQPHVRSHDEGSATLTPADERHSHPTPLDLLEADTVIPGDMLFTHEVEEPKGDGGYTHDPWPATEEAALDAPSAPSTPHVQAHVEQVEPLAATATTGAADAESAWPSFVSHAPHSTSWSPARRRAAWATTGLLGLMLAGQVAWHWREDLAVRSTLASPPLQMLAAALSQPLSAPAKAEAVEVENAALTHPPGAAGYKLSVQVRNRLDHEVAAPHMELSLTDAAGALVARKVLRPQDFQQSSRMVPLGEATWSLEFQADERKVAGYTVLAFYP